ncbi:hypothetical protein CPC08DRAFT_707871 [Agrocybe pediades]|nr:hypothetical protein CPC08DRAFT_707871 [Agrocybe pediades]
MDESQSTISPRIPPELILRIVELSKDSATLAALALTCKGITMDAQKRLYTSFTEKSLKTLNDFCSTVLEDGAKKASLVRRFDADLRSPFRALSVEEIVVYRNVMSALIEMVNLTELHLNVLDVRELFGGFDAEEPVSDLFDCTFRLRKFSLNVTAHRTYYYNGLDRFLAKQPTLQRVDLPYVDIQWKPLINMPLPHLRLLKAPTNFLMAILPHTEDLTMLVWRASAEGIDGEPSKNCEKISTQIARIRYFSYGEFPAKISSGGRSSSVFSSIAPYLHDLECLELFSFSAAEQLRAIESLAAPEKLQVVLLHPMRTETQVFEPGWIFSRFPSLRFIARPIYSPILVRGEREIEGYAVFDSKARSGRPLEPDEMHKITSSELLHRHIFELLPH